MVLMTAAEGKDKGKHTTSDSFLMEGTQETSFQVLLLKASHMALPSFKKLDISHYYSVITITSFSFLQQGWVFDV
jgi:hypothetical protein